MNKTWKTIFKVIQICLWIRFILYVFDPGVLSYRPAGNFFATYFFLVEPFYALTNILVGPVETIFYFFGVYRPGGADTWFPLSSAPEFNAIMTVAGLGGVFTPNMFAGAINWWIPVASIFYSLLSVFISLSAEHVKNYIWNIVIEYGFHRKKIKQYAEALNRQKIEIDSLSSQYKALARESHSLKDSVITDELTQIFNKRFFLNRLQQEFDACKKEKTYLSLIMIDIDYFKKLNDTYGHIVGDEVLKSVAIVLKRFSPDLCYPCRYGGEEFAIIMPRKGLQNAIEAARLIQENVQLLKFDKIDKKIRITLSQGICTVDFSRNESVNIKSIDTILEFADKELYRSKMEGRNRVSYHSVTSSS